ncbi:MAG: hypothetical protein HZA91_03785 [Verrucomicrobia bacterium]|nr:hypothetical protein [Verrucomicrobiota bacterium]
MQTTHETSEGNGQGAGKRMVVHLHMTRLVYVLLLLLLAMPWVALVAAWIAKQVVHQVEVTDLMQQAAVSGRFARGNPGPWGMLESIRIAIEPPEEFTYIEPLYQTQTRWIFRG